ncbi:40S ribosomal protein S6-like [Drosophila pseudoobscura]|uniref:40S ribosomal protein S6 n=1 Tax=Drosophila pseudoobscura pseudoobscura TaxID=46245 RepID=A0A6I8W9I4_DROPS|nr:40S ribosomal protein S6 [Drosophila pseudoobscura]
MKLNVSYPVRGTQKLFVVNDEHSLRIFYDKRMGALVHADPLGPEWKGYVLRITGGNDNQGFPMMQGILTSERVRLLLKDGQPCYRARRDGERRRKSVRGCIVYSNISVLALVVVSKGENDIPGLTDITLPRRMGPKRASKIRKLFNLSKDDDVRRYVVRRQLPAKENKKATSKAPKIQRLITPAKLQRRRHFIAERKTRKAKEKAMAVEYAKLLALRKKQSKARRQSEKRRRSLSVRRSSASA